MRNNYISLDYHTHYKSYESDWLVFIHGIGGNHSIFYKQIDFFKQHFNLLLIDLPGHGDSPNLPNGKDTLKATGELIINILEDLKIPPAHFIGVSVGTIVMQSMSLDYPERFKSMVLAGAAGKWLKWGEVVGRLSLLPSVRTVLPYMFSYVTFSYILLPKKNHKKSREIFIREASKLGKESYIRWANVSKDSVHIYQTLLNYKNRIPKLYISGDEDHMFLKGIKKHVSNEENAELHLIRNCGHVCNIEKDKEFNQISLEFLNKNSNSNKKSISVIG